jgi:hypothetical protein
MSAANNDWASHKRRSALGCSFFRPDEIPAGRCPVRAAQTDGARATIGASGLNECINRSGCGPDGTKMDGTVSWPSYNGSAAPAGEKFGARET